MRGGTKSRSPKDLGKENPGDRAKSYRLDSLKVKYNMKKPSCKEWLVSSFRFPLRFPKKITK